MKEISVTDSCQVPNQWAGVGLHLNEVVQCWDERDKRECAVLWMRLFRENVIQIPMELVRRTADVEGLQKAIKNLDLQREEIITEVMAGVNFLSKKIQVAIDVTAENIAEIIDIERQLLEMTLRRNSGSSAARSVC